MVAAISRIRDAITSLFSHSNKVHFHKRHINNKYKLQANKTRVHSCKPAKSSTHNSNASNISSTTQAQANNYNRKFISRFNCLANHLLKSNTTLASQIQSQNSNCHLIANSKQQILYIRMSANKASQSNPPTSPQTPRVTFRTQSTPILTTRAGPSNAQTSSSPEEYDIELSREEIFENNLNQLFTKSFLAVLTSKDAVLKEIRDCVIQDDEARCKEVSTYIHSFWKNLHVKSGCLCVDQRVAIPNSIKEAVLESIHMTHSGSWGMISLSLSQYAWWPYMHREILAKTSDCAPCTDIGKNLKPIIPKSKWHPHIACQEPNEEIQIDFGGPIINDKDKDIYFLTCIDRYSKYPTVRIFDNANGVNVVKFLRDYAYTHGIPRTIRLEQATCLVGKEVTNYCNENNIDILDAPVGDHRAIGLVERMIQTIKRRLSCMKAENKDTFSTSKAIKQIVADLRLTKQKTTKISPFDAHFGRPLRTISRLPSSLNLNYEKIVNHYLDAETVPAVDFLDEAGWLSVNRSDTEIEQKMCQASLDAGQRYRESDNKESRFITHPQITDPIPRTEQSLKVKLARKLPKKRAKRQLAGLYEVLKPGSFVTKSSPTTTIINEPGRSPVKVRDSDLAKFGTKTKRSTNLWVYAQRRPAPYEKTTEYKIAKHSNDLKKQKRGEIKIRHRQRDTTSVVSSVNSNVSRALMVRNPTKPQFKRRHNVISDESHENVPAPDQPMISIVPAPPVPAPQVPQSSLIPPAQDDQTKGRKRNRPQFYGFTDADISPTSSLASSSSAKPKKRKNKKDKKASKPEISVVALIQDAEQSRIPSPPRPDLQLGQVSPSDPGIRYFEYEQEREMSVWDAENEI